MAEQRCDLTDLTDLLVDQCGHCRGDRAPEDEVRAEYAALLLTGRWLPAQYVGRCSGCGESFRPGTPIQRGAEGWRGPCCSDEPGVSS